MNDYKEVRAKNLCRELEIDPDKMNTRFNEPTYKTLLRVLDWERDLLKQEFREFIGIMVDSV